MLKRKASMVSFNADEMVLLLLTTDQYKWNLVEVNK